MLSLKKFSNINKLFMETIIEILVDVSGSMGAMKGTEHENKYLLPDGSTRISLAKKILINEIVPVIDYASKIILRTFRSDATKEDRPVIEKLYDGNYSQNSLQEKINLIPSEPMGGTPITSAIEVSVTSLRDFATYDRKIILITDGGENGGGNYKVAAEQAISLHGIPCSIFIVGIALEKESAKNAIELARLTKGTYINLIAKNYNRDEIRKALANLKISVVKNSIQNIQSQPTIATSLTQPKIAQLEKKIELVEKEDRQDTGFDERLRTIEHKIEEHILNSQKLLSELAILRKFIPSTANLPFGVDATTLTIDPDYSESIRQKSEAFIYQVLTEKYGASKVRWLNINGESYSDHDFEIVDNKGTIEKVIECVGTPNYKLTFYLTSNEWTYFLKNLDMYQIYRVFNVEGPMSFFCVENLLLALKEGKVVPYLLAPETLKEHRVFLTLIGN